MENNIFEYLSLQEILFSPCKQVLKNPYIVETKSDKLFCYYFKNKKNPKAMTIVHFHGNGECVRGFLGQYLEIIDFLGLNIFFVEYRGYGESTGKPSLYGMLDDIEPIFKSINVPLERIIVYGRSFGSLYAIHAVSLYPKIKGLILESGIANLSEWKPIVDYFLGIDSVNLKKIFRDKIAEHFNNKAKISSFRGSTLILHSQNDEITPVSDAKKLFEWANKPKQLVIFKKGNHSSYVLSEFKIYSERISNFVDSFIEL